MSIDRYLSHKTRYEVALWGLFFLLNFVANAMVSTLDAARVGVPIIWWEPWVWEGTSGLLWLSLLPAIVAFDRRYPIQLRDVGRTMIPHLLFTLPVAVVHVCGMFGLRSAIYALLGDSYSWWQWWSEFGYEYLKDFRSYFSMIAIIYLYRFIVLRLQGLAEFVPEGREESAAAEHNDRFLVKKLGREFLVKVEDIDWLQASGNYVNLHVGARVYPLRETMTAIEARLASRGFARVHRSAIVNLDRVQQIVPFDSGDGEAHLVGDIKVPVSRRYRRELRERLA